MQFCLNPACAKPDNPDNNQSCQGCGGKLSQSSQEYHWDNYRIIQCLGQGGFGRTYLGENTRLFQRKEVIKKLIASGGKPEELFLREAEKLYQLSHPQIPEIYGHFSIGDSFYLIQAYIEGENLLKEFYRLGRFDGEKIRELLENLLPILEYLESQNIIHRDIKPENIMRCQKNGKLFLIDFGAVKEKVTNNPSVGTGIYTPGYAAPEQMQDRPVVGATDIYSLGATCIRLITGCFASRKGDAIYDDYENEWKWLEYLEKKKITLDQELINILTKMTEGKLKNRYSRASEVKQDLAILTQPNLIRLPTIEFNQKITTNVSEVFETTVAASPIVPPTAKTFSFTVITVDSYGKISNKQTNSGTFINLELGNGINLELVYILGGSFLMGSSDDDREGFERERPQHQVQVNPFWMGKYPVTQAQWQQIMGNNPSYFPGYNRPVERVSWDDCVNFCEKLSQQLGKEIRLPSEAEWEYACKAGTTTPFHYGLTLTGELANYNANRTYANEPKGQDRQETTEVGQFPPNAFGLYDLHGNIWEWCQDGWHNNYQGPPVDGSPWLGNNRLKVLRGGSWSNVAESCRSNCRLCNYSDYSSNNDGFRIVFAD